MPSRRIIGALVALGVAGFAVFVALLRPWPVTDPARRAAILAHLSAASGFAVSEAGAMAIRLAPRPQVTVVDIGFSGLDGAVTLQAEAMKGELSLGSLLGGPPQVVSASFERPTAAIDLDRLTPLASAAFLPSEAHPDGPSEAALRFLQTGGLAFRGGVVRLLSDDPRKDMLLTDVAATLSWPHPLDTARLIGSATWHGASAFVDAEFSAPGRLAQGGQSLVSVKLQSPVLDVGFDGTFSAGLTPQAEGRLSAATTDLPGFLRAIGTSAAQLQAIHSGRLNARLSLGAEALALSEVELGLDAMAFEGAMAVHLRDGRPALAATLATDSIVLDPFLSVLPPVRDADGAWSAAPLATAAVAADDIDLRVSASQARLGGLRFEDGSLSLQSGNGRMELSLGEARAYDGLLKGRVVALSEPPATDLRIELSLSRLDLAKLMKDADRPKTLAGSATMHLALAAHGDSVAALMKDLSGRGQISIRDGAVGPRVTSLLGGAPEAAVMRAAGWSNADGRFDSASAAFDLETGGAQLRDAWILWPAARAVLSGTASMPRQRLDLRASRRPLDEDAGERRTATDLTLRGPWQHLRLGLADALSDPPPPAPSR